MIIITRLLRSVAGAGVEQITELQTKWDKLELLMESHQLMIKEQVRNQGTVTMLLLAIL